MNESLRLIHANHSLSSRPQIKDIWRSPDSDVFKINLDAAFHSPVRLAITAVVARDSTGEIREAETYLFENVVDAFVAEARACERALIFASSMGFWRIAVEGDSHFVPCMANEVAHLLALEGRKSKFFGYWVDGVLDAVEVRAMKDILDWNQSYHSLP